MDSQLTKTKDITEEEFRSCYPDVSIQHFSGKSLNRVTASADKRQPIKTPTKSVAMPRTPSAAKSPVKTPNVKTPQTITAVKVNLGHKVTTPTTPKATVTAKTPVVTKSPSINNKTQTVTKTPVVTKTLVPPKTPSTVPIAQVAKNSQAALKVIAVKPSVPVVKTTTPSKTTNAKSSQNVVKQPLQNVVKTPLKSNSTTPAAKEDSPDQSSMTVLTYHVPQQQRSSNQLTIEKIDQQQRIPVVLDTNNQVVLQQVINNGHLVVQNRVAPAETSLQSVVIGTSAQSASSLVAPPVEITTSEPLQALQVTQQVTLFRPKGNLFTVDDVKKQISLNKQNAMTNVVSSTTNSIPAPGPVQSQQGQKKIVVSNREQGSVQSPVRQSNRVNSQIKTQQKSPNARSNYQSTRGQVKKVSPKREIVMQKASPKREVAMHKISPMQPPPLPSPDLLLANEEEVTTSENKPQELGSGHARLIVILPSGDQKEMTLSDRVPLNATIQDLLNEANVDIPPNAAMGAEMDDQNDESFQEDMDTNEAQWENAENLGPEPGEILGLNDELQPGESVRQLSKGNEGQRDNDIVNNEPEFREGLLALCPFCGYTSTNFNHCQHCQRVIPPDCKTLSDEILQKSRKTKADSLTGEGPKKKRACRKKRLEEPVCLTISDDEELLGLAQHHHRRQAQLHEDNFHSDSNSQLSSCDKEPVITDEMVAELKHSSVSGGGHEMEDSLDDSSAEKQTFLQCRTVRIGSYKVVPKDKVLITPRGLKVTVPVLNSDQYVELKIMYQEIIRVLIHFGRQLPVLFFYTRPSAAAKIRRALKMEDRNGFYYDTTSSDETHRRITLLPDKIDEECKSTLKNIFTTPEYNVFAELTGKEANDILVKASPKEVQAFILKKQPNNQPQPPVPFDGQNIQTIMVYPPPPEKGGIPINTEDYACLGEDQFLNDVIIDFYLKYVVEKTLNPEDRARTHVFSSFFYKRLTTKPPSKRKSMNPIENDPSTSPAVKRHSRVKSWTKNVNLFTKDFIVIPINESSHWFLAIICFPGLTGPVRFSDNSPIDLPGRKKKKVEGKHMVTIGSTTITAVAPTVSLCNTMDVPDDVEDRDEADGEDEDMDVPDSDEDAMQRSSHPDVKEEEPDDDERMANEITQQMAKKNQREPIKQPCILIFDSLAGASRSRVVATLRDYLRVEYEVKHGEGRDFSGDVMKGTNVRCPQQTNYTDCGLYVLQYVEAFFLWPVTDYRIPIKQLQNWFQADIVSRKRYEIQQLLHRLMQEQNIDFEALNLPLLNLRPEGKNLVEYSGTEEDDEDEEDNMCDEEDDDMLDDDGEYNEEMVHEHDEMEEGEIGHHNDDDHDSYIDQSMDQDEHELDEEEDDEEEEEEEEDEDDYGIEEDEEDPQEEDMEKELEDISLLPIGPVKSKDLRNIRIPRLNTKNTMTDDV